MAQRKKVRLNEVLQEDNFTIEYVKKGKAPLGVDVRCKKLWKRQVHITKA